MNVPSAAVNDLVFRWEKPGRGKWTLSGFLLGSLFLHALGFYLFQIVYPPAVALLPPPGRVSLISPDTDEGRQLLRWLEAEDPALASTTSQRRTRKRWSCRPSSTLPLTSVTNRP